MAPTIDTVPLSCAVVRAYVNRDPRTPTELGDAMHAADRTGTALAHRLRLRRVTGGAGVHPVARPAAEAMARAFDTSVDVLTGAAVYQVGALAGHLVGFSHHRIAAEVVRGAASLGAFTAPCERPVADMQAEIRATFPPASHPTMRAARIAPEALLIVDPTPDVVVTLAALESYTCGTYTPDDVLDFALKVNEAVDVRLVTLVAAARFEWNPDVQAREVSQDAAFLLDQLARLADLDRLVADALVGRFTAPNAA